MSRPLSLVDLCKPIRRIGLYACWSLAIAAIGAPVYAGETSMRIRPAAMQQFTLPMFGEDGYKIWDLQGDEGRYLGDDGIQVKAMRLRTYAGGETLVLETLIESDEALIRPSDNRAQGKSPIRITSDTYVVTGEDWTWDGNEKIIRVANNVRVVFSDRDNPDVEETVITSRSLRIVQTEDDRRFFFDRDVRVAGPDLNTTCTFMEVISSVDAEGGPALSGFESIDKIIARDRVVIEQQGRRATAGYAEIYPGKETIILRERPFVTDKLQDGTFTGHEITLMRAERRLTATGSPPGTARRDRVVVTLPPLTGFDTAQPNPPPAGSSIPQAVITSERLEVQGSENQTRFYFQDDVRVIDPSLITYSKELTIEMTGRLDARQDEGEEALSQVDRIIADGNVVIDQYGRRTTANHAEILPQTGRAILTGNPRVNDSINNAVVEGERITLLRNEQQVRVEQVAGKTPVKVTLPPLSATTASTGTKGRGGETIIESQRLDMIRGNTASRFEFLGNVRVQGDNLNARSDRMTVISGQSGDDSDTIGAVEQIIARGNVRLVQEDFTAATPYAEIFPQAEVKEEEKASASGAAHRFVMMRDDPDKPTGVQPRVILAPLANLGFADVEEGQGDSRQEATVVTSDLQEMITREGVTRFYFRDQVTVRGTNLETTCSMLEVISRPDTAGADGVGRIALIVATGDVVIQQTERTATAGRADIEPGADRLVLSENPRVVDKESGAVATGHRLILNRGSRRATIEGSGTTPGTASDPSRRPTIILPQFEGLNRTAGGRSGN